MTDEIDIDKMEARAQAAGSGCAIALISLAISLANVALSALILQHAWAWFSGMQPIAFWHAAGALVAVRVVILRDVTTTPQRESKGAAREDKWALVVAPLTRTGVLLLGFAMAYACEALR